MLIAICNFLIPSFYYSHFVTNNKQQTTVSTVTELTLDKFVEVRNKDSAGEGKHIIVCPGGSINWLEKVWNVGGTCFFSSSSFLLVVLLFCLLYLVYDVFFF
jgi:hypothetical protein